jgi:hypothetical protein
MLFLHLLNLGSKLLLSDSFLFSEPMFKFLFLYHEIPLVVLYLLFQYSHFVAVVNQFSITLLDCMLVAIDLLFELIDCGLKVLELFVVRPFHLLELVLKP